MLKPDCLHRGDNNTLQPECAPATLTNFNAGNVVLRPRRNLPPALSALPGCGCKSKGRPICTPIPTASVPDETLRPIAGPPDVYKPCNALQPFLQRYHLCYGDREHRHFKQPAGAGKLVAIANGVSDGVRRQVDWIHMPVPRDRTDAAYFAPLGDLRLQPGTELFLGLVDMTDGVAGALARIAAAQAVVAGFGVATECGFGRRDPATIPALLEIHSKVSDPL